MEHDYIETQLQRATDLLDDGKPGEALRCLDTIEGQLIDASERVECAALRAWALSELDRTEEALEMLAPLLEEYPESPRLLGTCGILLSGIDRLEEACELLERAVAIDADDGVLLANLGHVYEKYEDPEAALQAYEKSLSLGADVTWVLRRIAAVQRDADDHAAARATLKRYLSLEPDDAGEWISLAIVQSELGAFDESFACYERAEALGAEARALHFNWGLTAERADRLDLARAHLGKLAAAAPRSPQTSVLRAFVLEHEGDHSSAYAAHLEAITRLDGAEPDEVCYVFETAMDFCAEYSLRHEAEALMRRAYRADACTPALCEGYRELTGQELDSATWYTLAVEVASDDAASSDASSDVPSRETPPGVNEPRGPRPRARAATEGRSDASANAGEHTEPAHGPALRYCQVVAHDHDEALALAQEFLTRMGERGVAVREFLDSEPIEDVHTGVYEVEPGRVGLDGLPLE